MRHYLIEFEITLSQQLSLTTFISSKQNILIIFLCRRHLPEQDDPVTSYQMLRFLHV